MSYDAQWRELELTAPAAGRGFVARRIAPDLPFDLRLALGYPGRERALLLRASPPNIDAAGDLPVTRAVVVRPYSEATGATGLELALTDRAYADVFSALVEDVVSHIGVVKGEAAAALALVERVQRWQSILDRPAPEGLSPEEQRGLWGELWFLREHAVPVLGWRQACHAWTGPQRAVYDFRTEACAVEVKTTAGPAPELVRINGERQLESHRVGTLILVHVPLEDDPIRGESLPALVGSLRERCSGDLAAARLLEDRLMEAKYLDCHAPLYADHLFRARPANIFRVSEGFPRITSTDLAPGVGEVTYVISVAACEPFRIHSEELDALLNLQNES